MTEQGIWEHTHHLNNSLITLIMSSMHDWLRDDGAVNHTSLSWLSPKILNYICISIQMMQDLKREYR